MRKAGSGEVSQGVFGSGKVRQARRGEARRGEAWRGKVRQAGQGKFRRGGARRGKAVVARTKKIKKRRLTMIYQYLNNYKFFRVPAQVVGETLEAIEQRDGEVTKESLLEESRPKDAPTHDLFEWNNKVAAEKYRLAQAGQVIRMITVKVETVNKEPQMVRAYVNTKPDRITEGRFVNIFSGMSNEETRKIILLNALSELKYFQKKYSSFVELSKVFEAIDEIEEVS